MKNALIFIGGLVSGIVLTILALVIVSYFSNSDSDYSFFEKAGERIDYNAFQVFQVLDNGDALATGMIEYHDFRVPTAVIVLFMEKENSAYYDGQIIEVPDRKYARQIGTFKYLTDSDMMKTVPIVDIYDQ